MFKEDLIGRKEGYTDADQELRKENAALEDKVKILEKQNVDLQLCFRKHLKLIDVLKRQKVHLEVKRDLNRQDRNESVLEDS
jgi:cell division FtsZ-interacting protein ZapD